MLPADVRRAGRDSFLSVINRTPTTQIVAGVALLVAGVVGCVVLWGGGVIWGVPIAAAVMGPLLVCSGVAARRRRRKLEAQACLVVEQWDDLIEEIIDTKAAGGSTVALLRSKGIADIHIRQKLLREVDKRMAECDASANADS